MKSGLAKNIVKEYGKKLIGRLVDTLPFGEYPGGVAKVIKIYPDKNAPDIVCQVAKPHWGEIGILENEYMTVLNFEKEDP